LKPWDGKSIPPWYPNSPPWFHDENLREKALAYLPGGAVIFHMMAGQAYQMHDSSVRYKLFNTKMKQIDSSDRGKALVSFKEFEDLVTECGWQIGCKRGKGQKTLSQWREYWADQGAMFTQLKEGWPCPCQTMQVYCDRKGCGKLCSSVCICEEAYCSPECLRLDWENHKEMCLTVRENNALAQSIHHTCWFLLSSTQ